MQQEDKGVGYRIPLREKQELVKNNIGGDADQDIFNIGKEIYNLQSCSYGSGEASSTIHTT
jgi:hypothetical protein